jgi:hypothetical protein
MLDAADSLRQLLTKFSQGAKSQGVSSYRPEYNHHQAMHNDETFLTAARPPKTDRRCRVTPAAPPHTISPSRCRSAVSTRWIRSSAPPSPRLASQLSGV